MTKNFDTDKKTSLQTFAKFAAPVIQKIYGGGIIDVENDSSELARRLDGAGIDYLVEKENGVLIGVSARCHSWRDEKTFTIRDTRHGIPAERHKFKAALQRDGVYPAVIVQTYSRDDSAVVGMIDTLNLLAAIEHSKGRLCENGNVKFYSVRWNDLGDKVKIFSVHDGKIQQLENKKTA